MFLALFVSTTIIQVRRRPNLQADSRNARTLYESYSVERGPILVDGTPIASSVPSRRRVQVPARLPERAAVRAGHRLLPLNGEATGIEGCAQRLPERHGEPSSSSTSSTRIITGQDPKGAVGRAHDRSGRAAGRLGRARRLHGRGRRDRPATGAHPRHGVEAHLRPEPLAGHDTADGRGARTSACSPTPTIRSSTAPSAATSTRPGRPSSSSSPRRRSRSGKYTPESEFPNPPTLSCPAPTAVVTQLGRRRLRRRRHRDRSPTPCGSRATSRSPNSGMELGDDADPRAGREVRVRRRVPTSRWRTEPSVYPRGLDEPQTDAVARSARRACG